jgi:hypothetical protein
MKVRARIIEEGGEPVAVTSFINRESCKELTIEKIAVYYGSYTLKELAMKIAKEMEHD